MQAKNVITKKLMALLVVMCMALSPAASVFAETGADTGEPQNNEMTAPDKPDAVEIENGKDKISDKPEETEKEIQKETQQAVQDDAQKNEEPEQKPAAKTKRAGGPFCYASPSGLSMALSTLLKNRRQIRRDIDSAMTKLHHTAPTSWVSVLRSQALGTSSTSCRQREMIREYMPLPTAWKTVDSVMPTAAGRKHQQMVRRAGTPMAVKAASPPSCSKRDSSASGKRRKAAMPTPRMAAA